MSTRYSIPSRDFWHVSVYSISASQLYSCVMRFTLTPYPLQRHPFFFAYFFYFVKFVPLYLFWTTMMRVHFTFQVFFAESYPWLSQLYVLFIFISGEVSLLLFCLFGLFLPILFFVWWLPNWSRVRLPFILVTKSFHIFTALLFTNYESELKSS